MLAKAPWQEVLWVGFVLSLVFFALVGGAVGLAVLSWPPMIGAIMLIVAFALLLGMIPLFMNLSRSYFVLMLIYLAAQISGTLFSYAIHFAKAGLMIGESVSHSFSDALYFSVTTWTTLGYGDFAPVPAMRAAASMEALTGVISIAVTAALLWLWCAENLLPKELAFFDGDKLRKGTLSIHRMRIRTITGKERELGDKWLDTKLGTVMYHNEETGAWEEVREGQKLPENALIMQLTSSRKKK